MIERVLFSSLLAFCLLGCDASGGVGEKTNYTPPSWAIGDWGSSAWDYVAYSITEDSFVQGWPGGGTVSWVKRTPNDQISSVVEGNVWYIRFYTTETKIELHEDGLGIQVNDSGNWGRM